MFKLIMLLSSLTIVETKLGDSLERSLGCSFSVILSMFSVCRGIIEMAPVYGISLYTA